MATASFSQADSHPELPLDPDGPLHLRGRYVYVVFVGGMLGTGARYEAGQLIPAMAGLPLATMLVNLIGCFALGLLLELLVRRGPDRGWLRLTRLHLGTGFLGAFTTYSAMAVETVDLGWAGHPVQAAGYFLATLLLGAVMTVLGIWAGARWSR